MFCPYTLNLIHYNMFMFSDSAQNGSAAIISRLEDQFLFHAHRDSGCKVQSRWWLHLNQASLPILGDVASISAEA